MLDIIQISQAFSIEIKNTKLFEEAFTHRSAINEDEKLNKHNERLEFLGDAVLELIITDYLFHTYPKFPEGDLTNLRSCLVKRETLAQIARNLNFGQYLKISKGEQMGLGREKISLLANTMEAIIGAIYLDSGLDNAKSFIIKHLVPLLNEIVKNGEHIDAKSNFQEIAQARFKITPIYKELNSEGPDHNKIFEIGVFIGKKQLGKGSGNSKQAAQQAAARDALNFLKI